MFRKSYLLGFLTIALFLTGSVATFAQVAAVRGKIELKKADNTSEGVAGALIDIYRLDIKTSPQSTKSDKKGYFNFAGAALGGNYVLVISGPNLKPVIQGGIKAGMENILIPVEAGDGSTYTKDQVYQAMANPGGGGSTQAAEMTADQKKAKEEYDKQVAEITSKNQKAQKANEIVTATLKEGGAAYDSRNYDLAIAKFDEGYNVDPDFAGSAPVLLNNKSLALLGRATDNYNKSVKSDDATKAALKESAKNDLLAVVTASDRALEILKTATTTDANVQKNYDANKFLALVNRKAAYRLITQTGLDREKGKETLVAFQEYMAVETDPAKKTKAQLDLAAAMQDSNEYELAVTEYKKVLETDPGNVEALAYVGLNLVTVGYVTMTGDETKGTAPNAAKGKEQLQEAANYLQKFIDVAPPDHKLLASVKESINDLKNTQNLTPQKLKSTPTPKKKN